jgi:hypothetical protein
MPIKDWAPTLKANMAAIAVIAEKGQVHLYDELPATIMVFPTMLIIPMGGDQEYSLGGPAIAHHVVQLTLFVASQLLPEAYAVAVPFIELVRNALAEDMQLGANCEHCLPVTAPAPFYEGPGAIAYGDKEHLGIIFRITVKENESGTYPVSA